MKNQSLIDFYKSTIASLGLETTDDGYIKIDVGSGKLVTLTTNGKPLVLPTKDHIDTAVDVDDDTGKLVTTKILYNPLNEDVIKGDSTALKKTKDIVETRLSHSFAGVCELLLTLASNKKLQTKTPMEINKFLASLSVANNPGIKQIVDDKTITLWGQLYAKTLDPTVKTKLLKLYLKKSGTYAGTKYNRLSVLTLPLLDIIQEADRDSGVLDIKLRNKDIKVFELLYTYIFKDVDEHKTLSIGSNDPESPGFIALFKTYLTIGNRLNNISKSLKEINPELYDSVHLNLKVTLKELDMLNDYARELAVIPSELELNRQKNAPVNVNQTLANAVQQQQVVVPYQQQQVVQQQVVQQEQPKQPELTTAQKILYGNKVPIVPSYNPHDPNILAQAAQMNYNQAQYPQQVRPAGINSMPQQQFQMPGQLVYGGQPPAYPQMQQQAYPQMQQQVYPQMQQGGGYPQMQQQQVLLGYDQQGQPVYGPPPQQQVRPAGINSVRY